MTIKTYQSDLLVLRLARFVAVATITASLSMAAPAFAQSAANGISTPTPGMLQSEGTRETSSGHVAPPSAIQSSTDVMKGVPVQGDGPPSRANPIKHLPKDMR